MPRPKRTLVIILLVLIAGTVGVTGVLLFGPGGHEEAEGSEFYYTCPMHPSVISDKPGDCPICGMSLVKKEREPTEHKHSLAEQAGETVYTCPMHPSVVSDRPGDCPICGMSLVPRRTGGTEAAGEVSDELTEVTISPLQRVLANVATSHAEIRELHKEVVTVGRFEVDEQRLVQVSAWVGGRVERLYVDFTGDDVRKDQPLLELYSPSLIQTQEEYLSTLPQAGETVSPVLQKAQERLRSAARQRLLLWGITEEQIGELERSRMVKTTTTIYAPTSGTVLQKRVHEGMYVNEGQILFDIADLSSIWMFADVYEYELSFLAEGQKVLVQSDAHPGRTFVGRIDFIDPVVNPQTRTVSLRADFPNHDGSLRPKMFGSAVIEIPLSTALVIPVSAVVNTGRRQVVWEEVEPNRFLPRNVVLGHRIDEWYQVLEGLEPGTAVASSGGFLLDSESQLKAMARGAGLHAGMGHEVSDPEHVHCEVPPDR